MPRRDISGRRSITKEAKKLRPLQAALSVPGGAVDHGTLLGLTDDDHSQYVHISSARTITAQHQFAPTSAQPPFTLGANAQDQTVVGLRADSLNKQVVAGDGLTGGGYLTSNVTVNVNPGNGVQIVSDEVVLEFSGTPSTIQPDDSASGGSSEYAARTDHVHAIATEAPSTNLSVSSSNTEGSSTSFSRADHVHAVTTSSNPGAAEAILATDASGDIQIQHIGLGASPTYPINIIRGSTPQVRIGYDASNYADLSVSSGATLSITSSLIELDPTGSPSYVNPATPYTINLGQLSNKYLTLYAAELWVETLVAADTMATIGGRIIVAPTTSYIADVDSLDTTIDVKHNQMASGDRVVSEANGAVEWMAITSSATTITGGYRYSVTRDLDGSGANDWYAGDALVNTGTTGDGFIDLYSYSGIIAGSTAGPTIVGNVRTGTTYSNYTPHWAIGNLIGLYGYGSTTYGSAFGRYGSGYSWVSVDDTNGIRLMYYSVTLAQWDTSGNILVGQTSAGESNIYISSAGDFYARSSTTQKVRIQGDGDVFIGTDVSNPVTTSFAIFTNAQTYNSESVSAGDVLIGDNSSGNANIFWDYSAARLNFRGGTTTQAYIDTDGAVNAGGGVVELNSSGIEITVSTAYADLRSYKFLTGSTTLGYFGGYDNGSATGVGVRARPVSSRDAYVLIDAISPTGYDADILIQAAPTSSSYDSYIMLSGGQSAGEQTITIDTYTLDINANTVDVQYELSAGTLTSTGDGRFSGGIIVGASGNPSTGEIWINNSSTTISEGANDRVRITTSLGYVDIGLSAAAYCAFGTDATTGYYFDSLIAAESDIRTAGGLVAGSYTVDAGTGDVLYTAQLVSYKSSTSYTVYAFRPLTTPYTNTAFAADTFSDVTTSTIIQNTSWSTTIPSSATALLIQIIAQDSGAGSDSLYFAVGPNSTYWYTAAARPQVANINAELTTVVPCTNGDIYYRVNASGSNTMTVTLRVWGYFI